MRFFAGALTGLLVAGAVAFLWPHEPQGAPVRAATARPKPTPTPPQPLRWNYIVVKEGDNIPKGHGWTFAHYPHLQEVVAYYERFGYEVVNAWNDQNNYDKALMRKPAHP